LSSAIIVTIVSAASIVDEIAPPYSSDPYDFSDGAYNIINKATGEYLDIPDYTENVNCIAFLNKKDNSASQAFLFVPQDDGTYLIYPKSDSSTYCLSYLNDIMDSKFVSKCEAVSSLTRFKIIPQEHEDGFYYSLKPAGMTDDKLTLGVSGSVKDGTTYAGFGVENGSEKQLWKFVKVEPTSLTNDGGYTNLRMGYTKTLYTSLEPAFLRNEMTWSSSDTAVVTVDKNGNAYGVAEGTATITATCGGLSVSQTIKVTDLAAYTWYSQKSTKNAGWFTDPVKDLYLRTYYGSRKKFMIDGFNGKADWMDEGCKLCSEAMVLNNLGAKLTEGYDLRYDKVNNLVADPFTVMLANTKSTGYNLESTRLANDPVLITHSLIDPRFNVDGKSVEVETYWGRSLKHIKELLDEHPEGVVVGMYLSYKDSYHYVVFTECLNPEANYWNYEFRACDPAAGTPDMGDNIPYKQTASYKLYNYSYANIKSYSVYNVIDK